jgi:hypothetical protein
MKAWTSAPLEDLKAASGGIEDPGSARGALYAASRLRDQQSVALVSDYQPLEHHYSEWVLQVHVMSEFARRGLERIQEALGLVLAYFSLGKEEFIRRYLSTKPELLSHATTAQSYQRIVTDLANPAQIKLVTAPVGRNLLILAGPGSGKNQNGCPSLRLPASRSATKRAGMLL